MPAKLTDTEFLKRAKIIHGDKYQYLSPYATLTTKMKMCCPVHGIFFQTPSCHTHQGHGCPMCAKTCKLTQYEFIQKSNYLHNNKYDYSKTIYINTRSLIIIICPIHGEFTQEAGLHLEKSGCKKCAIISASLKHTKDTYYFIQVSQAKHNNFYDYSEAYYTGTNKNIVIKCPIHGVFEQTANSHMSGHGCPKCNARTGEITIRNWLTYHRLLFTEQAQFDGLQSKRKLKFDFVVDYCETFYAIEFDGIYHEKPMIRGKMSPEEALLRLEDQQLRDKIKEWFCEFNDGIELIKISYRNQNNIPQILENYFTQSNTL